MSKRTDAIAHLESAQVEIVDLKHLLDVGKSVDGAEFQEGLRDAIAHLSKLLLRPKQQAIEPAAGVPFSGGGDAKAISGA